VVLDGCILHLELVAGFITVDLLLFLMILNVIPLIWHTAITALVAYHDIVI